MAYSNKALPAGTVLREWRLEEVLGVGGFGIVYKGRGVYFDELVAIKEYFPSSISERNEGDTVVPIDSDAEEVHALGLKKFVEEAKLLWNLSTPSRHPNIVSVRSLFEIHGTAYMVMDFEDGTSLSKLIKEGRRFNEASLMALMRPIAEGLERAHRVGVLHRDIKPPNILVNDDGRPVLIDFGSARFESGDATSTKVTFHTPPYAAIEQYVKTYVQGPWTDIYAMGVVLYECITGEKPPEVLERMHGGLGKALVEQEWPGYSRAFLEAVDAAMTVRPADRPQSISEWLALFSKPSRPAAPQFDEDATRIAAFDTHPLEIAPVAPPPAGFDRIDKVETPVPDDISVVRFKRAGEDTATGVKLKVDAAAMEQDLPASIADKAPTPQPEALPKAKAPVRKSGGPPRAALLGGGAVVLAALTAGGWYAMQKAGPAVSADQAAEAVIPVEGVIAPTDATGPIAAADTLAPAFKALADDARKAGVPASAAAALSATAERLAQMQSTPAGAAGTDPRLQADMARLAVTAAAQFASALAGDVERRSLRVARDAPWADPRAANAARSETAERQRAASRLRQARAGTIAAAQTAGKVTQAGGAVATARHALAMWGAFTAAQAAAYSANRLSPAQASTGSGPISGATTPAAGPAAVPVATAPKEGSSAAVSPAKAQQLAAIIAQCRPIATSVISMGNAARPGSGASDDEKSRYRTLQDNTTIARQYNSYLDNLTRLMGKAKNDAEADRLLGQAEQTKRYLMILLSRSSAANR